MLSAGGRVQTDMTAKTKARGARKDRAKIDVSLQTQAQRDAIINAAMNDSVKVTDWCRTQLLRVAGWKAEEDPEFREKYDPRLKSKK